MDEWTRGREVVGEGKDLVVITKDSTQDYSTGRLTGPEIGGLRERLPGVRRSDTRRRQPVPRTVTKRRRFESRSPYSRTHYFVITEDNSCG